MQPIDIAPISLRYSTDHGLPPRMWFDLRVNELTKELALDRELRVFGEQFWRPYYYWLFSGHHDRA